MSLVRRGALGLALSALGAAVLAPAAHADNLDSDTLVSGTAALGNVCRGAQASGVVGFVLKRNGNSAGQVWAGSANVTVSPGSQPSGLTLGSTSVTTPANWATIGNNTLLDAGDASYALSVPAGAATGVRSALVTYAASGRGADGGTTTRSTQVTFSWTVVDCTPADTTAPVISKVLTPAAPDGSHGWYRSDVTVDWTVTDPESSVTLQGCADTALTQDGTLTSTCAASSAGGSAGPVGVTVERDATAPVLTPVVTGDLGADGWYVGDVTVTWNATDATSGVDAATTCAPDTLTTDAAAATYSCTVRDLAGNIASSSVTVKRDATKPVVVSHVSGTPGSDGWFTSDVDVSWDVSDATSTLGTTSGCEHVTLQDDTAGTSYTCTAQDRAGNTTKATVSVKRDATAPTATYTLDGTAGTNGWFRGPVGVDWTVADDMSGLGTVTGCVDDTLSGDGRHESSCVVTDRAGNSAAAGAVVDIDATAPVITPSVTGPTKGTEWFTGDVSVSWTVTDPTSGRAESSGCDAASVTEDTTGTTYTCSATDVAGNADSRSVTVKRDATAPVLSLTGGPASGATYNFGDVPAAATCTATDATSGVSGACAVSGAGTAVGSYTQVATATDVAGNVARDQRSYTVAAWRLDGFYKPVTMGSTVVNTVKAGSTVPLKFNVYKGTAPMTANIGATFAAAKVACDGSDVQDPVDFVTTGATSLRYDVTGGQWVQNWATPSAGKGSCYRVTMTTLDGSKVFADFALK